MTPHIPTAELDAMQEAARSRTAKFMFRLNVTMVLFLGVLFIAGCGTYNSWTPRTGTSVGAHNERSCASGYYNCDFRGGSHDSNGNAHGSK